MKTLTLPLAGVLVAAVLAGCRQEHDTNLRAPRLLCFAIESHAHLVSCGEIAAALAENSSAPGDRTVFIDASGNVLLDESAHQPEFLEPLSDVRRRHRNLINRGLEENADYAPASDVPELGPMLLHVARDFSGLSMPTKLLILVTIGESTFPSLSNEDLAVYGATDAVEQLALSGQIPNFSGFDIIRTGPTPEDVNMARLHDHFWQELFAHANGNSYRMIGWGAASHEIHETLRSMED